MEDCKEENKRLVKALVEQNQLTTAMLESLENLQRKIKSGNQLTEIEGSERNYYEKNEKLNPRKKAFKPYHLLN